MKSIGIQVALFLLLSLIVGATGNSTIDVTYVGSIIDSLIAPTSLSVDGDQLAVLEPYSKQLRLFTVDGQLQQKIDIDGNASGLVRYSSSEFLFCDLKNRSVVLINPTLGTQETILDETTGLLNPIDLVTVNSQLYVLDTDLKAIVHFDASLIYVETTLLKDSIGNIIGAPMSFDYGTSTQSFYVLDQGASEIWKVSQSGLLEKVFCSFGGGLDQVTRAGELSVGPAGNVFLVDRYQGRILIFSPAGDYLGEVSTQEMLALNIPTGIAMDNAGVLYVASTEGRHIQAMHVAVTTTETSALAAQLTSPLDNDTLSLDILRFVAFVQQEPSGAPVTGFDFEIFTADDTVNAVVQIVNFTPTRTVAQNSATITLTADWQPTAQLKSETTYFWHVRVRTTDTSGDWSAMRTFHTTMLPQSFKLQQNYPNPFNPETVIGYTLPVTSNAELTIYNILGQKVRTYQSTQQSAGYHEIVWDGNDEQGTSVASGIFFYQLIAADNKETKKMVLVR